MLTGFMGVGKTTIGQQIAGRLDREFIDVDEEIVKLQGMPITDIFKTLGEAEFRRMERDFVKELCSNARMKVVSLGGGAFMQEEVRSACLSAAIVVHLHLSWEAWKMRLPHLLESRPLLLQRSIEEVEQLYLSRQQAYSLHHIQVNTDQLSAENAAETIVRELKENYFTQDEPL